MLTTTALQADRLGGQHFELVGSFLIGRCIRGEAFTASNSSVAYGGFEGIVEGGICLIVLDHSMHILFV